MPAQGLWELVLYALLMVLPFFAMGFMLLALAVGLQNVQETADTPGTRGRRPHRGRAPSTPKDSPSASVPVAIEATRRRRGER